MVARATGCALSNSQYWSLPWKVWEQEQIQSWKGSGNALASAAFICCLLFFPVVFACTALAFCDFFLRGPFGALRGLTSKPSISRM